MIGFVLYQQAHLHSLNILNFETERWIQVDWFLMAIVDKTICTRQQLNYVLRDFHGTIVNAKADRLNCSQHLHQSLCTSQLLHSWAPSQLLLVPPQTLTQF